MGIDGFTIGAVGDISLGTEEYPFDDVDSMLDTPDLLFGNLECSPSSRSGPSRKSVSLDVPRHRLDFVSKAGFDVLNLANNHIMDGGVEAICEANKVLHDADILTLGLRSKHLCGSLSLREINNIKIGFLGYTESLGQFSIGDFFSTDVLANRDYILGRRNTFFTPNTAHRIGISQYNITDIQNEVEVAKKYCDFLVLSLHWGTENVFYPSPRQIQDARVLIDAGADLLLGHHPHVPQGFECHNGGLIAYSLGNFQFAPSVSQSPTNISIQLNISIDSNCGIDNIDINPIWTDERGIPHPIPTDDRERIRSELEALSDPLLNREVNWGSWLQASGRTYLQDNFNSYRGRVRSHGFRPLLEAGLWLLSPFTIRCLANLSSSGVTHELEEPSLGYL